MTDEVSERFRVGDWLVEPQLNTIRKGATSKKVEPKVMDLLVFFSGNKGQLQDKSRILNEVWPDVMVTENALHFAVVGLRKALEDDASNPRYLETVPKRGYRLIASVSPELAPEAEMQQQSDPEVTPATRGSSIKVAAAVLVGVGLIAGIFYTRQLPPAKVFLAEPEMYLVEDGNPRRIASGEPLSMGSQLYMELQPAQDLYVYVFNEDDEGRSYLLFPLPEYELQNPLVAKEQIRLPGSSFGEEAVWEVSSSGGREHFLVVATQKPLPRLDQLADSLEQPNFGDQPTELASVHPGSEVFRGVGRVRNRPDSTGDSPAGQLQARLGELFSEDEEVWIRHFVFSNPTP